jgi:hypothetical protein
MSETMTSDSRTLLCITVSDISAFPEIHLNNIKKTQIVPHKKDHIYALKSISQEMHENRILL